MIFRSLVENVEDSLTCKPDLLSLYTNVLLTGAPVETRSVTCSMNSLISVAVRFSEPLLLEMVENQSKGVCCPVHCVLGLALPKSGIVAIS